MAKTSAKKANLLRNEWPKIRRIEKKGCILFSVDARRTGTNGKERYFSDQTAAFEYAEGMAKMLHVGFLRFRATHAGTLIAAAYPARWLARQPFNFLIDAANLQKEGVFFSLERFHRIRFELFDCLLMLTDQ